MLKEYYIELFGYGVGVVGGIVSLFYWDVLVSCCFCLMMLYKYFGVLLFYLIRVVIFEVRKDVELFVINKYLWYC